MNVSLKVPSYGEVAKKYELTPLVDGNDIRLNEAGDDIATMPDGRWKHGPDDKTNALHYFLAGWCANTPILEQLFGFVIGAAEREDRLRKRQDDIAVAVARGDLAFEAFHELQGSVEALSVGSDAYAGAVMVVFNNLLERMRVDLRKPKDWQPPHAPLINGVSLGAIVKAAAANFRHYDEWARFNPPKDTQLASIRVIAAVLKVPLASDGSGHPFKGNVCPEVLKTVSDDSFEALSDRLFAHVKAMAELP